MTTKTIPQLEETTSLDEHTLFPVDTGTASFKMTFETILDKILDSFVGSVEAFAGTEAPYRSLLCYGQAVSRTTYAKLFDVIGTTYGVGDGETTFNLPDYRGRVLAGKDNMGGSAAGRITNGNSGIVGTTLGAAGGSETAAAAGNIGGSKSIAHTHSIRHAHSWGRRTAEVLRTLFGLNDAITTMNGNDSILIDNDYTKGGTIPNGGFGGLSGSGELYTSGVLSPPSGSNGSSAASGAMSANATINGSSFTFTGSQTRVTQPTAITNYIIRI